MTALASPLEISCKLHHQQPLSPFRRHGAAPRDYDSSRKGQVVSCDQLPAIANCPGYTRAFQGLTKTEFVNLMRHPEQGEFPYDPSGYRNRESPSRRLRPGCAACRPAKLRHQPLQEEDAEESAFVKGGCRGKLEQASGRTLKATKATSLLLLCPMLCVTRRGYLRPRGMNECTMVYFGELIAFLMPWTSTVWS